MRIGFLVTAASLFVTISASPASNKVFSGELQRVTAESIAIRLTDGIIIEARLAPGKGGISPHTLGEQYAVGDQVQITCAPIPSDYYAPLGRSLVLEVKKFKFLREATPEERTKALISKEWRQSPNLLKASGTPPPAPSPLPANAGPDWPDRLQRIRSHILQFIATLPNFVADESVERYVSTPAAPNWKQVDTIKSEITVKGKGVSRDHIVFNDSPWNKAYRQLPGFKWTDGFGSQLAFLFDENCPTAFEPEGQITEGNKTLSVIRYSSPPDGCEFYWEEYQAFYPAKTGRILLDEREENVIRLETNSEGFPEAFPMSASQKQVSWDFVKIGDAVHLLPVSAEIKIVLSNGEMRLARNVYTNHRHFEAASNITYH